MLYEPWCISQLTEDGQKQFWRFAEREHGRAAIEEELAAVMRSHYDEVDRIEEDIRELGYSAAAQILAERMPRSSRARSGELGEILATEFVGEILNYEVPVRRLRYKDGREMALRGDDFIGILVDEELRLHFLKGESKSRASLSAVTIGEARVALSRDGGRPTPTSLLFVADRLMEHDDARRDLGRAIRNEIASRAVPPSRIGHVLFTLSGNSTPQALEVDLAAADPSRKQVVVHIRIADHQSFIRTSYERALEIGNP